MMSNMDPDEWVMKNFKIVKQAIDKGIAENNTRKEEINGLRNTVTMLLEENQVLRQRMSVLQAGQVLGRTDGD